jgi:DNA-binding beta-propeller fold protein YncE
LRRSHPASIVGLAAVAVLALPVFAHAADGTWERAWGKDVVTGGGTGFEICAVAASCKAGDGTGVLGGEMDFPFMMATDAAGNVYVADFGNDRVQKFDSQGNFLRAWGKDVVTGGGTGFEVCTVAAICKAGDATGGLGGELSDPVGITVDASGNVYVADRSNQRIQKFDSDGAFLRAWGKDVDSGGGTDFEVCTVAPSCKAGVSGGLGGEFNSINQLAVDTAGNLYVADSNNSRVQKFDSQGTFRRTWGKDVDQTGGTGFEICIAAASCKAGTTGGLGGEFFAPIGVAADSTGAIYVSGSTGDHRIQKFDLQGSFQRAWGKDVVQTGQPGDTGTGFEICTTAASCKSGAFGGLGGELRVPAAVATDLAGNVYVGDQQNDRIQQFTSQGTFVRAWGKDVDQAGGTGFEVCTIAAGCKQAAVGGAAGELSDPFGIATDAAGTLYVADFGNHRIQRFVDAPPPPPPPPPPPGGGGGVQPPAADTASPDTTITQGPKAKSKKKKASFSFTSTEPGSTFQCKLDDGPFEPCTSPKDVKVKNGKHAFEVRATDPAGNTDPTPAEQSWKVKKQAKK